MQVIPVIDLRGGVAVHAIAGDRFQYQPVQHVDVVDGDVAQLAAVFARRKPAAIYVADLDAIVGDDPQFQCWNLILKASNRPLWIDAGVRNESDLDAILEFDPTAAPVHRVVVGTETLANKDSIVRITQIATASRVVLSLDRKAGRPLGASVDQHQEEAILITARDAGIRDVIALDLAAVGMGRAADFFDSWRRLMQSFPDLHWYLGGGVKDRGDLAAAQQAGFCGVLSATAILRGAL